MVENTIVHVRLRPADEGSFTGGGLFFIARFAIGNRASGLYVTMIKNRMNALAYAADGVD
ncbi:TPA: hypothetical protein MIM87_08520 [Klebsiella variicola]|nr:hypothetical protein [Klebsiella variicola subsp. variicola]PLC75907.1 hypothetical protein B6I40_21470 [Klebsiella variicola]PXJ81583.1 hypothetical protein DMR30_23950 [Klebsiella variicola]HBX9997154.1 hypothetical protein [Klebsiella variicola]